MKATFSFSTYKINQDIGLIGSTCKDYIYSPGGTSYFISLDPDNDFLVFSKKSRPLFFSNNSAFLYSPKLEFESSPPIIPVKAPPGAGSGDIFSSSQFCGKKARLIKENYKRDFFTWLLNIICSDLFSDRDLVGY